MTIDFQRQPNCAATVTASIPAQTVAAERSKIVSAIAKEARLPGYRPGKAPNKVVEVKYKETIDEELVMRLINRTLVEVRETQKARILDVTEVKPELEPGLHFNCKMVLTLEPEFELPQYVGLQIKAPPVDPTEEDIEKFIETLRVRDATFEDIVGRPAAMEDFAVTDAEGFHGGKPLQEAFPNLPENVASHKSLWIRLMPDVFLPGFAEQIIGMTVGETKEFDLDIPADFVLKDLAGEKVHYRVTLSGLKNRRLPDVDDEFAQRVTRSGSVTEMREHLAELIRIGKQDEREQLIRRQIEQQLLANVSFEMPASYVRSETRRIVDSIVRENTARGVSEEVLKQNSGEIVTTAADAAEKRVRLSFILAKIAEKENLSISDSEFDSNLMALARREGREPRAFRKELEKAGALNHLRERFIEHKALDFLVKNARVLEVSSVPAANEEEPVAG